MPTTSCKAFGGYFASVNRNKKSIAIDLKQPEGRELVMRLCDGADAVVENYRGGVMDRLGLGYETLHERYPKLVYATIRGFGDWRTGQSPYTDWPAYDVVAQALGGVMAITGPDKDTPMKVGPGIGDLMPATMCAFGIVSAILRAHKTGRGQFVDVGMVDAILSICERIVHQHSFTGGVPVPEGNHHPLLCPFGMFPAKDGYVTIAAHADTHFPDPVPPDRPAGDGHRPAALHRPGPPRPPGRDHRRGVGLHRPAHQAGAAGPSRRPGAVRAGQRRARHLRQPALRRP